MKKLSIFLYFTLISYVFSVHIADIQADQTFPVGDSIAFKIEVTPEESSELTLTGFSGKLENDDGTKVEFTCTENSTPFTLTTDLSCTVSLSEPGN